MKVWELRTRLRLPRPRAEVFGFFADAANLEAITPPWLHFRILTPQPIEMRTGARIDYRLRLHGIPIGWKTAITAWEPETRFVDEQLRGPYRLWVHEHTFADLQEGAIAGTLAEDRVLYSALGGALANRLLVERDLRTIFQYRHRKMQDLLGVWPGDEDGSRDPVTITRSSDR